MQRVIVQRETPLLCDAFLAPFDLGVVELLHVTAANAHDMVMMTGLLELENRFPTFKVVANEEPRLLELRQDPVYGGKPDVGAVFQELLVHVLGGEMPHIALLEDFKDAKPRQRCFEADRFEV